MGRKGQELATDVKNMITELFQSGYSRRKIGDILKIPKSTVIRKFVVDTGSVQNKPRSGQPLSVKLHDYHKLECIVKTGRRDSLNDITNKFNEENSVPVTKCTIQHHLHKHGYHRRVYKKKVVIREVHRKKRLAWCREKRRWTVNGNWKKDIFSDESKIMIGHDQRLYAWRKPDLVQLQTSQPKYEVMIWGCICWNGAATLVAVVGNINATKYQEILDEHLWPLIARHFPGGDNFFQDDNTPVHRARSAQDFVAQNEINGMSWPTQSPDINVIENVWLLLKKKLQTRTGMSKSKNDLFREIHSI